MLESMEVDSTPLQLKDMPDEVLFSIFEFLDAKSLKASRLVASSWNQIIAKSPELMRKFVLTIDDDRKSEFSQISNFSRCYQEIKFLMEDFKIPKNFVKIFREIGSKVKKVLIHGCEISSELEDLIRCFPLADNLKFNDCSAKEDFKFNPEVFVGCKSLEVSYCDQDWISCYENLQLTKLESDEASSNWHRLMNFLAKQTRLSTLFINLPKNLPPEVQLAKMQCPVENLSIYFKLEQLSAKHLEFLKLFGMTVKKLEVESFEFLPIETPFALLESISSSFKSLTHLELRSFKFTTVNSNLEFLKPLGSVKTMNLDNIDFETSEEFSKFFKLFPKLAEIKIPIPKYFHSGFQYLIVSESRENFFQCLFKLQNVTKFDFDKPDLRKKFFVLQNKHLSIKIGMQFYVDQQRDFHLALKIFKEFGFPKDELMMSRHGAQEVPNWEPVTEDDFAVIDKDDVQLSKIFDDFSVVIHKHF